MTCCSRLTVQTPPATARRHGSVEADSMNQVEQLTWHVCVVMPNVELSCAPLCQASAEKHGGAEQLKTGGILLGETKVEAVHP